MESLSSVPTTRTFLMEKSALMMMMFAYFKKSLSIVTKCRRFVMADAVVHACSNARIFGERIRSRALIRAMKGTLFQKDADFRQMILIWDAHPSKLLITNFTQPKLVFPHPTGNTIFVAETFCAVDFSVKFSTRLFPRNIKTYFITGFVGYVDQHIYQIKNCC